MILLIFAVRVLILGLALWFARSANPRVHVPAILILLVDLASLLLTQVIIWDPRAYAAWNPGLIIWFTAGSLPLWSILIGAVMATPVLALMAIGSAVLVGGQIWRQLWQRSKRRVWTLVAALGGLLAATLVLEISLEATMRLDALRIPNSGGMERTSAFEMAINGGSGVAARHHAKLYSDVANYSWSFRKGGWVRSPKCSPDDTVGCYAQDWR